MQNQYQVASNADVLRGSSRILARVTNSSERLRGKLNTRRFSVYFQGPKFYSFLNANIVKSYSCATFIEKLKEFNQKLIRGFNPLWVSDLT